ncbi:PaaX family transcriptional regulator [Actinocatenispora rupis]|uniref:PaaX family transcriptional regulator n=1 Tax=Actinocatenispora rupis TaxID=519421 RepID=A0A8J3J055_9ACTN|nr:PaaX family transcriptional regulator C-terminal domain-containing protein [Actinocatenispora rupis]GID11783.1 PaaX family transcriptional regulator [Actinocatenispora rupis]
MQARSALFDLYGDHLRPRGGEAPVAALVRLLAPLSITAPAVRTAVSRMVRQGWLRPVRLPTGPGYALTTRAMHRLDDAATRIYRTTRRDWDGRFDLIVVTPPAGRTDRARLTDTLGFLGFGALSPTTWAAPRRGAVRARDAEVTQLLTDLGVRAERFVAQHAAGSAGAADLVRQAWDLGALAESYRRFVAEYTPTLTALPADLPDEQGYATRFQLVHAWRTFLFSDPQLPPELLPADWPGTKAAALFDRYAGRLRPAADRYVDACLSTGRRRLR